MSKITKDQVIHVADLAKLRLDEDKIDEFTDQFEKILEMVEELDEVDTEGIDFTMSVSDNLNRLREDQAETPVDRDYILRQVPEKSEGFIKVPAMLEGGGDA